VPKTGSNLQGTIKAVLECQKTNGINPRSAIRPQQHNSEPVILTINLPLLQVIHLREKLLITQKWVYL